MTITVYREGAPCQAELTFQETCAMCGWECDTRPDFPVEAQEVE